MVVLVILLLSLKVKDMLHPSSLFLIIIGTVEVDSLTLSSNSTFQHMQINATNFTMASLTLTNTSQSQPQTIQPSYSPSSSIRKPRKSIQPTTINTFVLSYISRNVITHNILSFYCSYY